MADHEASKIDRANHLLLDQPLLRLPYELMRKNFRAAHVSVARESQGVTELLRETATGSINGRITQEEAVKNIDLMLARAKGMRRKLTACAEEEERLYRQLDARTAHLGELASMQTLEDVKYEQWARCRLDRLVVDYLLRHGYSDAAIALANDREIRELVDIETFVYMRRIRDSLRNRSVSEALSWCIENKKELRKIDSNFEFMLRLQQYIELVRSQSITKLVEAIQHARKHLIPFKDTYPNEVNQAAGLLACSPNRLNDSYANLWSFERWDMLAELFNDTHNQLLGLPPFPLLDAALSSGLSALKTPACHATPGSSPAAASRRNNTTSGAAETNGHNHHDGTATDDGADAPAAVAAASVTNGANGATRPSASSSSTLPATSTTTAAAAAAPPSLTPNSALNSSMCPICSPELNELARNVPYAHHSKSHVEHDLLMLPNGRVYGKARLEEYAKKSGLPPGPVRDPHTGEIFASSRLKKVYIT